METPDLSLILPIYNEGERLKQTANEILSIFKKNGVSFELIIVNDGSTDNTRRILDELILKDKNISVIHFLTNKGYGAAILEGIKEAKGNTIGWCDGDGQIAPQEIFNVYSVMESKKARAAKAVRVIRRESLFRKVQSFFFNLIFVLLFGDTTWDVNAKPKFMRREILKLVTLTNHRYFIDAEWVIRLNRAKIPFIEIPIEFLKRTHGKSKIYVWTSLEFVRDMITYVLRLR
ncbi:MAG: glycosyltransferase family 2 protein [Patescibacteria group bacterium]